MSLVTVAALTLLATTQDPPAVQLRHGIAAGSTFAFVVESDAQVDLPGDKQDSRMRFALHFAARVGDAVDSHAVVECRLHRIEAELHSPGANVTFDSAAGEAPGPLESLQQLVGQTFAVRVDGTGHIAGVTAPPALATIAAQQLGSQFDSLFAAYFVPLPEHPVTIGCEWKAPVHLVDAAAAGDHQAETVQRLVGCAGDRATIERSVRLPTPSGQKGIRFDVTTAGGRVVFAIDRGRVLDAELVLTAKATKAGDEHAPETTGTTTLRLRAALEEPAARAPQPELPHDR